MSNIVLFDGDKPLAIPRRTNRLDVNRDIAISAQYPTLSIKGKVFTLVKDAEKKTITRVIDGEAVPAPAIQVAILRMNMKAKVFYLKKFSEGDSDGARPDCFTNDGLVPSPASPNKQAEKCALCPHNQWGSRVSDDGVSKGKACSNHARIAIADPDSLDKAMLVRVPPASLKPLKDAVKMMQNRDLQYNEGVYRMSFDPNAASPKLLFRPVGLLTDTAYEKAVELFDSDTVRAIVGADEEAAAPAPAPAAEVSADELDAALAARKAVKAAATPAPAPKAEVSEDEVAAALAAKAKAKAPAPSPRAKAPAPAPTPAPAVEAEASAGDDDLLSQMGQLLGTLDD